MMYSYLTDEMVWALIREREDEARSIRPHTEGWPKQERASSLLNPLRHWVTLALARRAPHAPTYR